MVQIHHRDSLIVLGSWEFGGWVKAVGALSCSLSRYWLILVVWLDTSCWGGQSHEVDGRPAFGDDIGRRRAGSTRNVRVAGAMGVNHDSHHPTEIFSLSPVCAHRLRGWVSTWLDSWERNLEVRDEIWTFEGDEFVKISPKDFAEMWKDKTTQHSSSS